MVIRWADSSREVLGNFMSGVSRVHCGREAVQISYDAGSEVRFEGSREG